VSGDEIKLAATAVFDAELYQDIWGKIALYGFSDLVDILPDSPDSVFEANP
jgi:hypothetical protein